jgi:hypothetical protein
LSIAFYGAAIWTLWAAGQKHLENFENVVLEQNGEDQLDR